MNQTQAQTSFLAFFVVLLLCDFAAQLAITAQLDALAPLVMIWMGPLDDILYGLCGLQALYFMLDPAGQTREEGPLSTTAMVKRCAGLLSGSSEHQERFVNTFFSGGVRVFWTLSGLLALMVAVTLVAPSEALVSLRMVLQAHLGYLLPICAAIAGLLSLALGVSPGRGWLKAFLLASAALLISALVDGRLANYLHHLFAALSNLQSWGAALSWLGVGAAWGKEHRTD